jgi:hypothetical protein
MTLKNNNNFKIVPMYTYVDYDVADELTSLHLIFSGNEKIYEKIIDKNDDIVRNVYFGNLHGLKSLLNKYGTIIINNNEYSLNVNTHVKLKYELNLVVPDQLNIQVAKLRENLENETHDYDTQKKNIEIYKTSCEKIENTMYKLNKQIQEIKKKQKNY